MQLDDPNSMLALYRQAIAMRGALFQASVGLRWHETGQHELLAFSRGGGTCVVNFGDRPLSLPQGWDLELVQASGADSDRAQVPANSAAWFAGVPAGHGAKPGETIEADRRLLETATVYRSQSVREQ